MVHRKGIISCSCANALYPVQAIQCDKCNFTRFSTFKYGLSTMGVSKESISKFLIGNRFHVKLRILSPYSNRLFK